MSRTLRTAAFAILVPACAFAQVPRNQPQFERDYAPELAGKPSARLRIVNAHPHTLFTRHVPGHGPGKSCEKRDDYPRLRTLGGAGANEGWFSKRARVSIGMPMPEPVPDKQAFVELAIPAGEMLALSMQSWDSDSRYGQYTTSTCTVPLGFIARPGGDYELTFLPDPQKGAEGCGMRFVEWVTEGGGASARPAAYERLQPCK